MSIHTAAGATIVTAALLFVPAAASARPADQVNTGDYVNAAPIRAEAPVVLAGSSDDNNTGADTLTLLAVAGGTLLAGAAGGLAGGRVLARRETVRS